MTAAQFDLRDKVVLVTGGGYGMGRASARRFAACGARVVIADVHVPRGEQSVQLIQEAGGEASFFEADVSSSEQVQALIAFTRSTYGGLDYAHNNAGIILEQTRFADFSEATWDRIIRNNLTSVFLCMKYEIAAMLERGGGAIVNVASETTYKGNVGDPAYTASKHGVVGLTTVAALQYVKRGIRVNAIAPGNVDTGIFEEGRKVAPPEFIRQQEQIQPIGRLSTPEEIADIVVWLCSDSAGLINGARIAADTGWNIS